MVIEGDFCSRRSEFESPHRILHGRFYLILLQKYIVCLKKTVKKQKEAGDGPFNQGFYYINTLAYLFSKS